jgi:hypothetical protein
VLGLNTAQTTQNNGNAKPKGFINCIFFDEQFKPVGYRISSIGGSGAVKDHAIDLQNLIAPKNGFIYIYCSNESATDVFFDNLQVLF